MLSSFEKLLFDHVWIAILLWIVLSLLNYWLSLQGTKLKRELAHIVDWEGSYEVEPRYKSLRLIYAIWFYALVIWIAWAVAVSQKTPQIFSFVTGVFVWSLMPVFLNHVQNIVSFKLLRTTGAAAGEIHYARWLGLRLSATWLLSFAVVFLVLFLMTESWFFPGGALMCFITGVQHWRRSSRLMRASLAA